MAGLGLPELIILIFFFLPFIINFKQAKNRKRSVPLWMLLTLIFSWIATLVLAITKPVQNASE